MCVRIVTSRRQTTPPLLILSSDGRARPQRGHREIYFLIKCTRQLPVRKKGKKKEVGQKEREMKDGNMDKMKGRDGQGHVTMEILQQRDVKGDCCDYLT